MSKQNMQSKSKKQVQQAVLGLLLLSKEATFDLKSTFTLNIDNGVGIVYFEDEGRDFSPPGYDPRDTVAGICIDIDSNKLLVMTKDCEDQVNFLEPHEAVMAHSDWVKIYNILHSILVNGMVIEA